MKILLTCDRYFPAINGVTTSVMNLKKALEKKGHEVKVVTLSESHDTKISNDVIYIGSHNAGYVYPDVRAKVHPQKESIEPILSWHPDIIHVNTEFSTFLYARKIAKMTKTPMVLTYHTDYEDYVHYVHLPKLLGHPIIKRGIKFVTNRMEAVIAPTEKTKKILEGYHITKRIDVIPTGLDLERYKIEPTEAELDEIRERHGIKKNTFSIIFVGRMGKEKNIGLVIDYLSRFKDYDFQFIGVGDGPDFGEIKEHVKRSAIKDRTFFTGMVAQEDIAKYYRLGDLFVSASQSETQGLTYIEALAAGVPILCKYDHCLDGVVEQGKNGWTFEKEEEFREYLDIIISDRKKAKEMGQYAAEMAFKKFSSEIFAEKILDVYKFAINNKS
ncbi:MAG: glycosyltransferase [Sphaerochaetaceae bacterium]|nr:glycosyltransferase [Sphaerochaetaceae bacterium]